MVFMIYGDVCQRFREKAHNILRRVGRIPDGRFLEIGVTDSENRAHTSSISQCLL